MELYKMDHDPYYRRASDNTHVSAPGTKPVAWLFVGLLSDGSIEKCIVRSSILYFAARAKASIYLGLDPQSIIGKSIDIDVENIHKHKITIDDAFLDLALQIRARSKKQILTG